jgi:hypothetical protein
MSNAFIKLPDRRWMLHHRFRQSVEQLSQRRRRAQPNPDAQGIPSPASSSSGT